MSLIQKSGPQPAALLAWQMSDQHGWGIAGMNIFTHWAIHGRYQPVMLYPLQDEHLRSMNQLRKHALAKSFAASNQVATDLYQKLMVEGRQGLTINIPVVHALGIEFSCQTQGLKGSKNIGRIVFEHTELKNAKAVEGLYDCYVVASRWNEEVLKSKTNTPVILNHEGVDPSIFHPGPRSGLFDERYFLVFSGGKIEHRKGQDLVLKAFKLFAQNKPDARLVTAWQSPFPHLGVGFSGVLEYPVEKTPDGRLNVIKWAVDNGLREDQIIDLGQIPHVSVPYVLRDMHCALQLSRAEGGTNFVAMEALACGIPTIVSSTTGHLDLQKRKGLIPVDGTSSQPIAERVDNTDWRDADMGAVVDSLNYLYRHRADTSLEIDTNVVRTWDSHANELSAIVEGAVA